MKKQNFPLGEGNPNFKGHTIVQEWTSSSGDLQRRIAERPSGGSPYIAQKKINAYNFPFTGNPGSGCFFNCVYCYLRQPFFQRHVSTDHGKEMNFVPNMAEATRRFLRNKRHLPQYMKRVQMGVSTELFMPQIISYTDPGGVLKAFAEEGEDWMVHLVTKSPKILDFADQLAEMKHQVQVEVSLVTLDEKASRIFEQGTPSVAQRLRIIEELSRRGIFVRMMLMPVMREYQLAPVAKSREIVFRNERTGEERPGRKSTPRVDGNFSKEEIIVEIHNGKRWTRVGDGPDWKPILVRDWSLSSQAQANWKTYGASAYKQKDLNYFYIDELIAAHEANRAPKEERGRIEDPSAEILIHSGESVIDRDGSTVMAEVEPLHIPKKKRPAGTIHRPVMDFGYMSHSDIDWVDCV